MKGAAICAAAPRAAPPAPAWKSKFQLHSQQSTLRFTAPAAGNNRPFPGRKWEDARLALVSDPARRGWSRCRVGSAGSGWFCSHGVGVRVSQTRTKDKPARILLLATPPVQTKNKN